MANIKAWTIGTICMLPLLAILLLLVVPFAASDLAEAAYYSILISRPSSSDLAGHYKISLNWGSAELALNQDGSFQERLIDRASGLQTIEGHWTSEPRNEGVAVSMAPYLQVADEDHGQSLPSQTLNFYKERFGSVFGELNHDNGLRFRKQQ